MAETETPDAGTNAEAAEQTPAAEQTANEAEVGAAEIDPEDSEEISYHAVEKEGNVTAIWEMQGRKHLRTIAPRSSEGKHILNMFTSEHHEEAA